MLYYICSVEGLASGSWHNRSAMLHSSEVSSIHCLLLLTGWQACRNIHQLSPKVLCQTS